MCEVYVNAHPSSLHQIALALIGDTRHTEARKWLESCKKVMWCLRHLKNDASLFICNVHLSSSWQEWRVYGDTSLAAAQEAFASAQAKKKTSRHTSWEEIIAKLREMW